MIEMANITKVYEKKVRFYHWWNNIFLDSPPEEKKKHPKQKFLHSRLKSGI